MKTISAALALSLVPSCVADEENPHFRVHEVGELEIVASFSAAAFETPESVALDHDNDAYVSMALTGELRKVGHDGSQETHAVIPLGPPELCQGPFPGILGALAIDVLGNLYVGANACDPSNRGVWRVRPNGKTTLLAPTPATSLANGIAVMLGRVYVADSASPTVWTAATWKVGAPVEAWTTDPLLADPDPTDLVPGANGLQFYLDEVLVANAATHSLVAIPFDVDGLSLEPGPAYVKYGPAEMNPEHELPPDFPGCDDFALDIVGRIYCTTDPFQTVARIDTDGTVEILLDASDGIDGPTAAAFGRGQERKTVYVTSAAFPFFPGTGAGPSLARFDVEIGGYPLR